jgi:hypothetical protein
MNVSRSIDLHDCTVQEAISKFLDFYNTCVRSGYRGRIEVIHGYGSTGVGGIIKQELRKYLAANTERIEQFIAGDLVGNPGVTILYPKRTLKASPQGQGSVPLLNAAQKAIQRLCVTPKVKERILTKLRGRFGDRVLLAEIGSMVQSGALEAIKTGDGTVLYKAASKSE